MVMTDPIADLLTRIRNANIVRHETVEIPSSNIKKAIANIMLAEGYIKDIEEYNDGARSEEHTSELQSRQYLVCRLLLEKKNMKSNITSLKTYTHSSQIPCKI